MRERKLEHLVHGADVVHLQILPLLGRLEAEGRLRIEADEVRLN